MHYVITIILNLLLSAKISKSPESRRVGYFEGQDVRCIAYPSGRTFFACSNFPQNYEVQQQYYENFFEQMKIVPVKDVKASVLWTPETPKSIEPTRVESVAPRVKRMRK